MSVSGVAWAQLKSITATELLRALERDGWQLRKSKGSCRVYRKGKRMVAIHYHPDKTFGPKMLKSLLQDIGWEDSDLRRLKLIKKP
jgi:predicted RNA binding protein YcfA (HicA-like mRNA interferase family)